VSLISDLRSLVFLRRIAKALESLAESQRQQTKLLLEAEERRQRSLEPRQPKPMEIGVFDPREASKQWRAQRIKEGWTEEELEEEYGPAPE
jgi:hypothetical protein